MKDRDKLVRAGIGIWVNPADKSFDEKMWRFGKQNPESELQKARILCNSGRYGEAKECYRHLLQHKETMYVHRQLASLCTLYEALEMAASYKQKSIKSLYYNRVLQHNPNHKEATAFFRNPLSRIAGWISIILLIALLLWGLYWLIQRFQHEITITTTTTAVTHTDNYIYGITDVPKGPYSGAVNLGHPINSPSITKAVDTAGIPEGETYKMDDESGTPIGYVTRAGKNAYDIYLLKSYTPAISQTAGPTLPVSQIKLNTIRTAYDYYLQSHHGIAPKAISDIQPYLPDTIPSDKVAFHSSAYRPAEAITEPNGLFVPFQKPTITVNLPLRNLTVRYGNETILSTPIGIGPSSSPTPIGEFTITNRIQNHGPSVYGPYIFPLNNSEFAIHGTDNPKRIGQTASLGCVEVPNNVDKKLFQILAVGTPVVITDQKNGTVSQPTQYRN